MEVSKPSVGKKQAALTQKRTPAVTLSSNISKVLEQKKLMNERELQDEIASLENVATDPEMASEFEGKDAEYRATYKLDTEPKEVVQPKNTEVFSKAEAAAPAKKDVKADHKQDKFNVAKLKHTIFANPGFQQKIESACAHTTLAFKACKVKTGEALFCQLLRRSKPEAAEEECNGEPYAEAPAFVQISRRSLRRQSKAPEDELAKEMTHDLEMNFNKIAPFGKEDTAKELQDHAAKTQDTLVDAVENAEVAEIKRAVFRALTRLRAATIKEFDTIARLETQAIDAYNDAHHYRAENPLAHLHEDEAPVETDKLKSFH
jgi:hypothetical protein